MAGIFVLGEEKIRPGSYFRIKKNGDDSGTNIINGVAAVIFRSDFGPIGKAVRLSKDEGYESTFGTGGTTDAVREVFKGGASTVIAVRLGSAGKCSSVTLNDDAGENVLMITTKQPGSKEFSVTIREKITDASVKECIIYSGSKEFEKVTFIAGEGEAASLVEALSYSSNFEATLSSGDEDKAKAILSDVSQKNFSGGEDPNITIEDYSEAFSLVEPYIFNTICVDTEDLSVHSLLYAFVNRIFDNGSLSQAVVAEKKNITLEERERRAAAYNDEKMHYVLNAKVETSYGELDGYQTAARIAGMIAAVTSNSSLTHMAITEFTDICERLTPTEITKAETMGCIVLSMNSKDQVQIDSAINTLITPPENKDNGWKKIRRVKTRFELLRRCNDTTDALVGKVDNDTNGRLTIKAQLDDICFQMRKEGKINSYAITEDPSFQADGDSVWFIIDVVDKDSAEHIYTSYGFQFSTREEE